MKKTIAILGALAFFTMMSFAAVITDNPDAQSTYTYQSYSFLGNRPNSQFEFRFSGDLLVPGYDDLWDTAYGASAHATYWMTEYVGINAQLGLQSWQINEDNFHIQNIPAYGYIMRNTWRFYGDALMIPLGISVRGRLPLNEVLSLGAEGGVKYVFVSSDVEERGFLGGAAYRKDVDIDSGAVLFIETDLMVTPTENIQFFCGIGYQFDISKGGMEWSSGSVSYADNELKAVTLRLGVSLQF